jgi:uncharacterized Zn-finger protein
VIFVPEIVEVDNDVEEVSCDGGKTFGHPRIYMVLGDDGEAECYYCGRRFVRRREQMKEKQDDAA